MSSDAAADPRASIIIQLGRDRRLAHATFFAHRHPDATPDFHYEIVNLWHSDNSRVLIEAFRGGAKSTLAEEAIVLGAVLREFKNCIVLGETYDRACERLKAIKHELENNDFINELFGNLVGETWQEGRIVLTNGVCIQAFGRGQSLRGSKHLDARPDFCLADDVESEESVATPEAIEKCMRWLMSVVMPALAPGARVRMNGTPLSPRSVLAQLAATGEWTTKVYPVESLDPQTSERQATWPARFTLPWIDKERSSYEKLGLHDQYMQEYMCQAEDASQKVFTSDMFVIEPTVRAWQPVSIAYDPARTVNKRSDFTGKAAWSWIGNRLIVWECEVHKWKPDEIVNDMFAMDLKYGPIDIGVEEDGLNEFIMQPIRHEQTRRSTMLPVRALKAPKGKVDFIKGLQPFFKAHEIIFTNPMTDLRSQLLSFPTGHDDAPNVLAYALKMRPGQPVYENFSIQHIVDDLDVIPRLPCYLALNATGQMTAGALVQIVSGVVHILGDWIREGDPGSQLKGLVQDASLAASGQRLKFTAGPSHFIDHDTIGLRGAAAKLPIALTTGAMLLRGRDELRGLLRQNIRGGPMLRVSSRARWTLAGLSGGYARDVTRAGVLTEFAVPNQYRVLLEGIEALAGLLNTGFDEADDNTPHYAYTKLGRRYTSALAR